MTVLIALLLSVGSFAQNHNDHQHVETIVANAPLKLNGVCTDWKLDNGSSCALINGGGKTWRRECAHNWDMETFCWNGNPNTLDMVCTQWYRESAECITGEDVWARECGDVRYKKHLCSNTNPNNQ